MPNAITIPSLVINGIPIPIMPNTLEIIRGKGTTQVKARSYGTVTESVFEKDQTEAISHLKFSVEPVDDMLDLINQFQDFGPTLDVQVYDVTTGFSGSIKTAVICNDPSNNLGADKTIDVEIKGDPFIS